MSQPTIQQAIEINGTSTEATAIVTAATSLATALTAAEAADKMGGGTAEEVSEVVLQQLQDELIDLCERIGQNLNA